MKSPTAGFQTAMAKTGSTPVWLLELDGNHYADRAVSDGTNSYTAEVVEWSDISAINDRMSGGGVMTSTSVTLTASIHADVRIGNSAKIYLWFENESLGASDRLLMFSGIVADPVTLTETEIVCALRSIEDAKNAVIGELISLATFANARKEAVGEMMPIIYGSVKNQPAYAVSAGGFTQLASDLTDVATTIALSDASDFDGSDVILIDGEDITLGTKSGSTFTGCTRGTSPIAHDRGATVVNDQANYDFLIADHAITALDAVYSDGVAVTGGTLVASGGRAYVRFTSHPFITETEEVTENISVNDTIDFTSDAHTAQPTQNITTLDGNSLPHEFTINTGSAVTLDGAFSSVTGLERSLVTVTATIHPINASSSGAADITCRMGSETPLGLFSYSDGGYNQVEGVATANFISSSDDFDLICEDSATGYYKVTVISVSRVPYTEAALIKSGSATKTGTVSTINRERYVRGITVDCTGYSQSSPDEVVEHLLLNYGNSVVSGDLHTSLTADSEGFGSDYDLGFRLGKQSDLMILCRKIAYQSYSKFHWDGGLAKLSRILDANLATNGGFEAWTGSVPDNWTVESDTTYQVTGAEGSGYGCAIDGNGVTEGWFYQDVTVVDGGTYVVQFVVKTLLYAAQIHITKPTGEDIYAKEVIPIGTPTFWGDVVSIAFTAIGTTARVKFGSQAPTDADIAIDNVVVKPFDKLIGKGDTLLNSAVMRWTPYAQIINSISAPYALIGREYTITEDSTDSDSIASYGVKEGTSKFRFDIVQSATTAGNTIDGYIGRFKAPKRVFEFKSPLTQIDLERGDIIGATHDLESGWNSKLFYILETHFILGSGTRNIPDSIRIITEEL